MVRETKYLETETQNLRPKTMDTCHIWDLRSRALTRTKKNKNPQQESYTGETKTQDMDTDVKTQDLSSKIWEIMFPNWSSELETEGHRN